MTEKTQTSYDLDFYVNNINSTPEELKKLPSAVLQRQQRIVDAYTHWTRFPREEDRDVVAYIMCRYNISQNSAYEDLRLIKSIMGEVNKVTKDFARYQFDKMIMSAYRKAESQGDARSMAAAAAAYGKFHKLDKDDTVDNVTTVVYQMYYPMIDPRRAGFKRKPYSLKEIHKLIKKHGTPDMEIVRLEKEDYDLNGFLATENVQDAKYEVVND